MKLSRRALLQTTAAFAVAAGAPEAVSKLAKWLKGHTPRGVPALAADGSTGRLVVLDAVPEAGRPAVARAAGAGHSTAAVAPGAPAAPGAVATHRFVMVIDLARCDGCGACTEACNAFHFVPPGQEWIKVCRLKDSENTAPYWFPRPCMQCDNPPCVTVCPVSATYKREDGIVMQDNDRCIGCRFCIAACPYGARYFNWVEPLHSPEERSATYNIEMQYPHRKGVVEKCVFCPSLVGEGELPACARACPMGAIWFGDEVEDIAANSQGQRMKLSELIRQNGGYRYLEELGTEPRVYYLPPRRRVYPAPPDETAT